MNWLWVVAGAVIGTMLLRNHGDGLLIGAVLGALFSLLERSGKAARAMETRVQALERKLAQLQEASPPIQLPAAAEPAGEAEVAPPPIPPAGGAPAPQAVAVEPAGEISIAPVAAPAAAASAPAPRESSDPAWSGARSTWFERLLGGNLLAKAGVVLLFFGVASGLKMAADYGLFPPAVRLLLAALAGIALIGFGHNRARHSGKQAFGFALQGGGFALLYLSLYFAFSRYGYIGAAPAFAGFALLGVGCALLAVRQDSPALAWLGLAGAFFAPALASTGGNQYRVLFGHFLLLDLFIVGISSRTGWRSLNLLGFFLTTLFGALWALERYEAAFRPSIEIFLLLFFLLYTLAPALLAYYRKPAARAWLDGALLFGVPAVTATAQGALGYERDYLALTAVAAALYYLGLALLTRRSDNAALPFAFAALALTCLTLAVPLAFGASVTTVFWAAEGAAVLAFGLQQRRSLAAQAGVVIQALAALRLLGDGGFLEPAVPFWNDFLPGALALSLAGAFSAWQLHRHGGSRAAQGAALAWALGWWLLAGGNEVWLQALPLHLPGLLLLWMAVAALALEWGGARLSWPAGRYAAGVLWPAALIALLAAVEKHGHVLAGALAVALPLALIQAGWTLRRQQADGLLAWLRLRHLALFWTLMLAAAIEAGWRAEHLAPATPLWAPVAILAVLCAGLAALRWLRKLQCWPVRELAALYQFEASLPLVAGLLIGVALLNFNFSGAWNLAYVPVFNPLDIVSLLALYSLWQSWRTQAWIQRTGRTGLALEAGLGLLWLTAVWARIAHHYLGVEFTRHALQHSALFQAGVSLLWTAAAIAAMLLGSRQHMRQIWFAGIGLLCVVGVKLLIVDLGQASLAIRTATLLGMGGLILVAGYFAPVPPKSESGQQENPADGEAK